MLAFARFLPANANAFQKILFGDCVVGFDEVSTHARAGPNKLTDNSIGYGILWNRLRKIDDRFAKSRRSLYHIVIAVCLWFFTNEACPIVTKRVVCALLQAFDFC